MTEIDLDAIEARAKALINQQWFVLGPPWAGFTETFTILGGSPDPHAGTPILETISSEEVDEDDDHANQELLADYLENADPETVLALIAEVRRLRAGAERLTKLEGATDD